MSSLVTELKRIVISHWDLDGLAGATIINLYKKVSKTILSSITALTKYLATAITSIGRNGEIWITDLNPQVRYVKDLRRILIEAKHRKIMIYWFDHHEWDKEIYNSLIGFNDILWYRVDPSSISSDLVARYFDALDNSYVSELVDLAFDDDFFINRYETTIMWRRILRWYGWPIRYKALKSFIRGELRPAWMLELYRREVKNIYENLIRETIGRADYVIAKNGLKFLIFQDVDPRVHPGEITLIAKQNGLFADIYIIRYPRGISLRSDYIDVSLIAKMLGGGGHRNAAGIPGLTDINKILEILASEEKIKKEQLTILPYLQ